MPGRFSSGSVSTRLCRIAEVARKTPAMVITTLAHHIDLAWMYEAFRQTRKSGAVGVDKVRAEEYAADLEANLLSLLDRFKSGTYFAPPVRRVQIPKGDGSKTRPIGIPTFDFLGFTHYWGRSRKGNPIVKRKTAQGRFARLLKRFPLPPPKIVHSIYRHAANPCA